MSIAAVRNENNCLYVSGKLNFQTVMTVWETSLPLLANAQTLNFDFSEVVQANSAALALLLEWASYARQHHKSIVFNQVPPQLKSIANVCGIESLLLTHSTG